MLADDVLELLRPRPGKKIKLKKFDPAWDGTDEMRELSKGEIKERANQLLDQNRAELAEAQSLLYADNRYALLVILQAMDTAGKDGTIKHVMSGVSPQGCQVFSFKKPSSEELEHTFLWRYGRHVPERGWIGIFNRSYYEDVLVVKVHPERLGSRFGHDGVDKDFWQARYDDINAFERHLVRNGTLVLKFFLHLSKGEQKKRLLERIENPQKHWKFAAEDVVERGYWDQYLDAYEDAITETNTEWAPWYIVPADHKWVTRAVVADILAATVRKLKLKFPPLSDEAQSELDKAKQQLLSEE